MYLADEEEVRIVVNGGGHIHVRQIESLASEIFIETPRFVTFVHHVQKDDDSEFFCVRVSRVIDPHTRELVSVWQKRRYMVPRQELIMLWDPIFGHFVCARVVDQEIPLMDFWLLSHCTSRSGFAVSTTEFTPPMK